MKKAISISLLLLANIILLAHVVVPHHHHGGIAVSWLAFDCDEHNDHDHHHNCNGSTHGSDPHEHENSSNPEDCVLNGIYTRFDNDTKVTCHLNCDHGNDFCSLIFGKITASGLADVVGLPFRQKPYLVTYHSIFSSCSNGLRAPPAC